MYMYIRADSLPHIPFDCAISGVSYDHLKTACQGADLGSQLKCVKLLSEQLHNY
jgi:hypothetical protein